MRRVTRLLVGTPLMFGAAPAVALSPDCGAQQTHDAAKTVAALGPKGAIFNPILDDMRVKQQQGWLAAKPAETALHNLNAQTRAEYVTAHPGASDAAIQAYVSSRQEQSALYDGLIADNLLANYNLHILERNLQAERSQILQV
jgi:hypothetical protein